MAKAKTYTMTVTATFEVTVKAATKESAAKKLRKHALSSSLALDDFWVQKMSLDGVEFGFGETQQDMDWSSFQERV